MNKNGKSNGKNHGKIILDEVFEAFIAWSATPLGSRRPRTLHKWAKENGINNKTLTEWQKRDEYKKAVRDRWDKYAQEKVDDVLRKHYQLLMAMSPSTVDKGMFQLFYEITGVYVPKNEFTANVPAFERFIATIRGNADGSGGGPK